jgi:CheY-like chemotaxis protein
MPPQDETMHVTDTAAESLCAMPGEAPQSDQDGSAGQGAKQKILVVDDNHDAADTLAMLLEFMGGSEVRVVNSGQAALDQVAAFHPDVVLLDIGMPGMDGHEVARRIRSQPQFASTRLVALTGWGQDEDRRRTQESGFDHHLTKPVDIASLQGLLSSL